VTDLKTRSNIFTFFPHDGQLPLREIKHNLYCIKHHPHARFMYATAGMEYWILRCYEIHHLVLKKSKLHSKFNQSMRKYTE